MSLSNHAQVSIRNEPIGYTFPTDARLLGRQPTTPYTTSLDSLIPCRSRLLHSMLPTLTASNKAYVDSDASQQRKSRKTSTTMEHRREGWVSMQQFSIHCKSRALKICAPEGTQIKAAILHTDISGESWSRIKDEGNSADWSC